MPSAATHSARAKGFTLMELLVAMAIAGLVLGALAGAVVVTINAWSRLRSVQLAESAIVLEQWGSRFSKAPIFSGIPFEGTDKRMAFPALVWTSEAGARSFGRVEYWLDESGSVLMKEQSYGAYLGRQDANPQRLLEQVLSLKLEYLRIDSQQKTKQWVTQWEAQPGEFYPWAIRLTIVLKNSRGGEVSYIKSAFHPVQQVARVGS